MFDSDLPIEGYSLFIGDTGYGSATSTLRLVLRGDDNDALRGVEVVDSGFSVSDDNWFRVRMDVIPVGPSNDIIRVYTAPINTETWTLQLTHYVARTQGQFVAAGASGAGKVGYWAMGGSDRAFIDRFQVFLEDI